MWDRGGRRAGILLHPTSLPGRFGIGDLGPEADRFVDWASAAGIGVWQVLPLGPPDGAGSPYAARSSFAGNPLLVSPERLIEDGLVPSSELEPPPGGDPGRVDFATARAWKDRLLARAFAHARTRGTLARERERFVEEERGWLRDWALYAALRDRLGGDWTRWDAPLARREPAALERAERELAEPIALEQFRQFAFFRQWDRLRRAANERRIELFGDVAIYPALDSADVWASPGLFLLDGEGRPAAVAGVPPDDFSATGQLWGNPLYRWERMAEDGFAWWIARIRQALRTCGILRLDHFRGFAAYWAVPGGSPTAIGGEWRPGPGEALFRALGDALGVLPLVAEDLGHITDDVRALREAAGLPGMRVLQFGFGRDDDEHLPHRHVPRLVAYTATHDNDTARGWFGGLDPQARARVLEYTGGDGSDVARDLVRLALGSVAELAVAPVQDVLGLGSEARLNTPGTASGNWTFRLRPDALRPEAAERLRRLVALTGRLP